MSTKGFIIMLVSIIVFMFAMHYFEHKSQCDGQTRYYVLTGKFYPCRNYHAP